MLVEQTFELGNGAKLRVTIYDDGCHDPGFATGTITLPNGDFCMTNNLTNLGCGPGIEKPFECNTRGLIAAGAYFDQQWEQIKVGWEHAKQQERTRRMERRRRLRSYAGGVDRPTGGESVGLLLGARRA